VPEGDTLHRAARRLQALVGERVEVETPHGRAAAAGIAPRLSGRRLLAVEARGKNLVLRFEGGYALRSHLGMRGRWRVQAAGKPISGTPSLVLRGAAREAVLWHGARLELSDRPLGRLGPDVLADPPDLAAMVAALRAADQRRELGEALLDQRLVAGIGNLWRAEALWRAGLSPWLPLGEASDEELRSAVVEAARLMRASLAGPRPGRAVYRRAGRPCPRCGEAIRSRGQGDAARVAYWCPGCQRGKEAAPA
jgi:endonuclease-8